LLQHIAHRDQGNSAAFKLVGQRDSKFLIMGVIHLPILQIVSICYFGHV
jgi:hypothetical protein